MKTFSAFTDTQLDSLGADYTLLYTIALSGKTLRLCNRIFGENHSCTFDGNTYDALVVAADAIETGSLQYYDLSSTSMGQHAFTVDNSQTIAGHARFAMLLRTYALIGATVTVDLLPEGATAAADAIRVFVGTVEQVVNISQQTVDLMASGFAYSKKDSFGVTYLNETDYPGADPDDLGKMLPIVYGDCKRVPFRKADAGWLTSLSISVTDADTTLALTDASGLPASGNVWIDGDDIPYTGKAGNSLTGCTIGVAHDAGAAVAEKQTYYYFIVGHAVHSIGAVYIDGVLADSGNYDAYTGQAGDNCPGVGGIYDGLGCIRFSALPELVKQINWDVDITDPSYNAKDLDTDPTYNAPAINDETTYGWGSNPSYSTDDITVTAAATQIEVYPDDGSGVADLDHAYDGNEITYTEVTNDTAIWTCPDNSALGTATGKYIWLLISFPFPGDTATFYDAGSGAAVGSFSYSDFGDTNPHWVRFTSTSTDWEYGVRVITASGHTVYVHEIKIIVTYTPAASVGGTITNSGNGSISKTLALDLAAPGINTSGKAAALNNTTDVNTSTAVSFTGNSVSDTLVGQQIAADVEGYEDTTGDYGGAGTLIERPDNVLKHLLITHLGLASGNIDGTSYTAAGTFYGATYKLAVCLLQKPNPQNLLYSCARQAKSLQFFENDVHYLIHIPTAPSTDKQIDATEIDQQQAWGSLTEGQFLINSMVATYDHRWSGFDAESADIELVTASDATSISDYGAKEADVLRLWYVGNSTQAQAVIDWLVDESASPRYLVDFIGRHSLLALQKGDIITFNGNCRQAFCDMVDESDQFRVLDVRYMLPDAVQVKAVSLGALSYAWPVLLETGAAVSLETDDSLLTEP
jgi:hypothetical protein